ncbi:GT2 family glycosyltransferase [Homoserinimonas aerilata]|uniref:GT2 family glycosyltransferase n=1 Tax=Homoserinimonas aerilata TaxID=1162970 RepID=A0A542YKL1_9MICO|nr:glycosyltransferase [Homoserinimonas aerilata]TQL48639.1 GT2 family glycosyltransferase [Homoserinimonas aerilata]
MTAENTTHPGATEPLDIMMPFWGSFEHFRLAVESVLAQEDQNWRLTIVDDVYPDLAPGEWAKAINDPRVSYIRNEKNLRPSRNYNKSVGLARSEFVVIMGCDDVMLPGYVGRVRELIRQHPDADIIQPGVSVIDENGAASKPLADRVKGWYRLGGTGVRTLSGEALAVSLLRGNWTYFPSLVWRTSRLSGGFRTDLDVVQDLAMLFDIAKAGGTLVLDDQVVFNYRRHSNSVSAVTGPDGSKFRQERTLFYEAADASRALGWARAARVARNHVTSRLNALTELPGAIVKNNKTGKRTLTRHVLGLPY